MIKENDQLPTGALTSKGDLGIQHYDPREIFAKGVILFLPYPAHLLRPVRRSTCLATLNLLMPLKIKGYRALIAFQLMMLL